jgi:hypothetical protein
LARDPIDDMPTLQTGDATVGRNSLAPGGVRAKEIRGVIEPSEPLLRLSAAMTKDSAAIIEPGSRIVYAPVVVALVLPLALFATGALGTSPTPAQPPQTLHETGLYAAAATFEVAAANLAFTPQYPLWTDGATKRRWIFLPRGTAIDASDPDAFVFPVGTRLWKEFSFAGVRVETRYLEHRGDGQWLYAAYAWRPDGTGADLVPPQGRRKAYPLADGRSHTIPGSNDCKACHEGAKSRVLGFSALQLSPDRDPAALHGDSASSTDIDLGILVERGLVVGLPKAVKDDPPRIAAATATERTALGYLHGNCGHCHNAQGPLRTLGMVLRQSIGALSQPAIETTVGQPVRERAPGQSTDALARIDAGHPERSALMQRLASRYSALQMPPLGTELVDHAAVELIRRWIGEIEKRPNTPQQQKGS